jgi:hypothetical protein
LTKFPLCAESFLIKLAFKMNNFFLKTVETPQFGSISSGSIFRVERVRDKSAIKSIEIDVGFYSGSNAILRITVTFFNGEKSVIGSGKIPEKEVRQRKKFIFSPGEGLKDFVVYCNQDASQETTYVVGVRFTTTNNKTFSSGNVDSKNYCELDAKDSPLYGFYGRSGAVIDSIGLIVQVPVRLTAIYDVDYIFPENIVPVPQNAGTILLSNNTSEDQISSLTSIYGKEQTASWSVDTGTSASITLGAEFTLKTGIPRIAAGEVTTSVSATAEVTFGYSYGKTITHREDLQVMVSASVPAGKTVRAELIVSKSQLDIEYIAKAIATYVDGTQSEPIPIKGRFSGVSQWNLNVQYSPPQKNAALV